MAGFRYRLQKVFELRERKKKEQEQKVIQAQNRVKEIENQIEEKKNEIRLMRENMLSSHHTLMTVHDAYIHKLNDELDELYIDLDLARQRLAYEKRKLVKAQADLEALVKHKDKVREEWLEEQKRIEMKQLDEVAGQRFFRQKQADREEMSELGIDPDAEDAEELFDALED